MDILIYWKYHFYPLPIQAIGYCRDLHPLFLPPSVHPSCPGYHSTAHNIQQILFIFGTVNDLDRSMDPIDYGVSMFIVYDPVAL